MHRLPTTRVRSGHGVLAAVLLLAMAACGGDDDANRAAAADEGGTTGTAAALPTPEGAIGSVTGMPANPGPGTSRIVPAEPAVDDTAPVASAPVDLAWSEAADADVTVNGSADIQAPRPDVDEPVADAPPRIIVPEVPVPPVATDAGTTVPSDARDTTTTRPPIGTEAATESTTIVVEPDDTGGSR